MKPVMLASVLACLLGTLSCSGEKDTLVQIACDPLIHSVHLNPASANVVIGTTVTLVASVDACPGVPRDVVWSTSNQSIATVDSTGIVTPRAMGTATIIAALRIDQTVRGDATINVVGDKVSTGP